MRYLLIISLLTISFQITKAQAPRKLRLGFNFGISRSLWQLPKADLVKTNILYHDSLTNICMKNQIGMQIGASLRYPLTEKWDIRILYSIALTEGHIFFSTSDTTRIQRFETSNLCLPIQVLWKISKNANTPYLFAGITPKYIGQYDKSFQRIRLKNVDMSLDFGMGFQSQKKGSNLYFCPELHFSFGLNNLLKNENSLYYVATSPLKYHSIALILNLY